MENSNRSLGSRITAHRSVLASLVVDEHRSRNADFLELYGENGYAKTVENVSNHLAYLSDAIAANSPHLFEAYVDWLRASNDGFEIPKENLVQTLEICGEVLAENFPDSAVKLWSYVNAVTDHLSQEQLEPLSFIEEKNPLGALARQYLELMRAGQRAECSKLILSKVEEGVSVKDIYLNVLQPTLRETGRLWLSNQMSIAEEHYCTAATQLIMSQLSSHIFGSKRIGKTLVASCVGSELHEIGLRMVADFFEMEGWDTYYLGSSMPSASILEAVRAREADLLLISTTMTFNVGLVEQLIKQVRAEFSRTKVPIVVGGYPFNVEPGLWMEIGADGNASTAAGALEVVAALVA